MCQLLGISANKNVDAEISLTEFKERGEWNPHGFGIAFWDGSNWDIDKAPEPAPDFLEENPGIFRKTGKTIIGHVRYKTQGDLTMWNTHPFRYNNWVFAHNGNINKYPLMRALPSNKYPIKGQTDSEIAFYYLLEKIDNALGGLPPKINNTRVLGTICNVLKQEAMYIRENLGWFNFLLSNGEYLFAYGDTELWYLKRNPPYNSITVYLVDAKDAHGGTVTFDLDEMKGPREKAIIVATEPLTKNETWVPVDGLMVFKGGRIVP